METLPDYLKSWIAENLLLESDLSSIIDALVRLGYAETLARDELAAAQNSPYLKAAFDQRSTLRKRESLLKTLDRQNRMDPDYMKLEKKPVPPFKEFMRDYYYANRPGWFSGAADHWPAMHWTPRNLVDIVGANTLVELQRGRNSNADFEVNKANLRMQMPFGEFIDIVDNEETNDVYLTANNMALADNIAFSPLHRDIGNIGENYLDQRGGTGMYLWIGPRGTVTPLHHDATNNLFIQVYGTKRFRLMPSMQAPYVYNHHAVFSRVNLLEPDFEQFPLFRYTDHIEVTIGPGDFLFLPVAWWHHVVSESPSISLTFNNVKSHFNAMVDYPDAPSY